MPGACLRCCKYAAAAVPEAAGVEAFAQHTDTTLVTLAMCSTVPGLEIKSRDGFWQASFTAAFSCAPVLCFSMLQRKRP